MPGSINQPATGSSLKSRVADGCVKVTPGKVSKENSLVGYCFSITYDIGYYKLNISGIIIHPNLQAGWKSVRKHKVSFPHLMSA